MHVFGWWKEGGVPREYHAEHAYPTRKVFVSGFILEVPNWMPEFESCKSYSNFVGFKLHSRNRLF